MADEISQDSDKGRAELRPGANSPGKGFEAPAELARARSTLAAVFAKFSKRQVVLAIGIAAVSDLVGAFVTIAPPFVWIVDFVTALLLFAVLGWQWLLLPGLVMEAIPGVGVIPFWLVVVAGILLWGTARPKFNRSLFRDPHTQPPER